MKWNISLPATSGQKLTEVDGEHRLHTFYEKYMAIEVAANALGEEWKVYVVQISDGDDKQGFPMKQGVHLLLSMGHSSYRPRRTEQRRCKSYSQLGHCKTKRGGGAARAEEYSRLTDTTVPCVPGPKENSRICKLFNLSKEDVICQYVMRKALNKEGKKPRTKAPKIQHPVTQHDLQHKCWHIALKKQCIMKNMEEAAEYAKLLAKRMKEAEETHQQQTAKSQRLLSSLTASTSKSESSQKLDCLRIFDHSSSKSLFSHSHCFKLMLPAVAGNQLQARVLIFNEKEFSQRPMKKDYASSRREAPPAAPQIAYRSGCAQPPGCTRGSAENPHQALAVLFRATPFPNIQRAAFSRNLSSLSEFKRVSTERHFRALLLKFIARSLSENSSALFPAPGYCQPIYLPATSYHHFPQEEALTSLQSCGPLLARWKYDCLLNCWSFSLKRKFFWAGTFPLPTPS
ncbi:unnamed protein product [Nyctereutes procyonoides]|uniref:Small ribosomal subunit protein eS6 n=1 Tax=Nyctereutes procyonoides TaxID=34880 RepID=A0A811ZQW4_NYCPR|nr:unnamed protein product [Nyctereutes procyonoides]